MSEIELSMKLRSLMLVPILLTVFSCIPREEPPDPVSYLQEKHTLPGELNENSGLISFNGLIWYINDSGNDPEVIGYSEGDNSIQKILTVKGVENNDWEDITLNEDYVFIGDFGNNSGTRTNLRIIRLNPQDLLSATDTIIPSGIIEFSYEDQTDFSSQPNNTPFDCEAFIASSDSIFLFTKDWVSQQTRVYSLPTTPGTYQAKFRDQWNVEGLITSAAWSDQSSTLILLGYTPVIPFVVVYEGFDPGSLDYASSNRSEFENYAGVQTEGITITVNGTVIITSEAALGNPARMFFLNED